MWTVAFFTDNAGNPAAGLTPTIRIRDLASDTLVITDQSMTEVGDGFYKYNFTTFDSSKDYSVRCDGGSSLLNRYVFGGNESFTSDASVWDTTLADHLTPGTTGDALNRILNNTASAVYTGYGS